MRQARCIEDLENILDDIEQDCGIQAMNHDLKDALVAAVLAEVPPEDTEWTPEVGTTLHKAARLCNVYGRWAKRPSRVIQATGPGFSTPANVSSDCQPYTPAMRHLLSCSS